MKNQFAFIVAGTFSIFGLIQAQALAGGCPGNCNGHGTCNPDTTCSCFTGYAGAACDQCGADYYNYPTCTFCQAASTCSGNGTCTASGTCNCNVGWTGAACDQSTAVPTVSEWGLAVLTLVGICAGVILFSRRAKTAQACAKR
ncbi:MAG: hypothetical protein HY287_04500 [Planctomycetes bacterium]|nr:hypothetical protein [Planctomycetota bacterium]MBI3833574.1 hypothetical protein [Planctomycetota bacterium]